VVAVPGGVQPVDGLRRDPDGGVEAERVVGRRQVVVDRLRHPDGADAGVGHPAGDAEGVLAADRDQRVDPAFVQGGEQPLGPALDRVRVGP
jgi:hypothetical protein